jgi:hypothetical protein
MLREAGALVLPGAEGRGGAVLLVILAVVIDHVHAVYPKILERCHLGGGRSRDEQDAQRDEPCDR